MALAFTGSQMRELFPHALDGYVQAVTQGGRILDQYGVTSPLRLAHFLAQCAAETGGFTITEEDGDYSAARLLEVFPNHFTPAQARAYAGKPAQILARAYASRMGNGGELTRDGWTYRGRGMIQLTGRENYARRSAIAGIDLVKDPGKAADCFVSLKIALQEWIDLGLNEWADHGATAAAVLACSRGINCGSPTSGITPNGLDQRRDWFAKIWKAIGGGAPAAVDPAADGVLEEGERGAAVLDLQKKLIALGYKPGIADGIYGEHTAAAVMVFQQREGLGLGGAPGKWQIGAYDDALAKAKPFDAGARGEITAQGLLSSGDEHTARTSFGKRIAGYAAGLTAVGQGVSMIQVDDLPNVAQGARAIVEPVLDTLRWALHEGAWVLAILGFAAVYVMFHRIQAARVADVQQGKATP